MEFDLESIKKKMSRLRVDRNASRYSAGKAPHKPVLLISLMILDRNHRIDLSDIKPELPLREIWGSIWQECLEYSRPGPLHLPMYHMRSDSFWDLKIILHQGLRSNR